MHSPRPESEYIRLACRRRFVREFLEGFIVDTITHAFVCASHAEPIGCIRQFETSVKHMVAASAAVEHLLAHVGFLRFVFFFWWQQDGGRITTQHWEVLVAQIFVYVPNIMRQSGDMKFITLCTTITGVIATVRVFLYQRID